MMRKMITEGSVCQEGDCPEDVEGVLADTDHEWEYTDGI